MHRTICRARLGALAAVAFVVAGCGNETLFQAPPKGATPIEAPVPSDSTITLMAQIPFAVLKDAAASKIPASMNASGGDHIACANVPYVVPPHVGSHQNCFDKPYLDFRGAGTERVCVNVPDFYGPSVGTNQACADYNWHAKITPDGALSLQRADDALRVEQPLRIDGQAGVGGDLARVLALNAKNFEAHLTPGADFRFTMDSHWCPQLSATPTQRWVSSATMEVVGRNCAGIDLGALGHPEICAGPANLDLTNEANKAAADAQSALTSAVSDALSCDKVRPQIAAQWRTYAIKVGAVEGHDLFLNITPTAAAFSGLIVEDAGEKLVASVSARTSVDAEAIPITTLDLPPLALVDASESRLDINVQANAPYDILTSALRAALVDKTFSQTGAGGATSILVKDVTVYPSGENLAVGVKIKAHLPGRVLDTSGWVYLIGKPVAGPDGASAVITDLHYAAVLDNAAWRSLVTIFNEQILRELRKNSTFDLRPSIQQATADISQNLNGEKSPGVVVAAGEPSIALQAIAVGNDGLIVNIGMKMPFSLTLSSAAFAH